MRDIGIVREQPPTPGDLADQEDDVQHVLFRSSDFHRLSLQIASTEADGSVGWMVEGETWVDIGSSSGAL